MSYAAAPLTSFIIVGMCCAFYSRTAARPRRARRARARRAGRGRHPSWPTSRRRTSAVPARGGRRRDGAYVVEGESEATLPRASDRGRRPDAGPGWRGAHLMERALAALAGLFLGLLCLPPTPREQLLAVIEAPSSRRGRQCPPWCDRTRGRAPSTTETACCLPRASRVRTGCGRYTDPDAGPVIGFYTTVRRAGKRARLRRVSARARGAGRPPGPPGRLPAPPPDRQRLTLTIDSRCRPRRPSDAGQRGAA